MNCFITDFGACPDGTLSTKAIQAAIDACFTAGGGEVIVPEGRFLTGGVRLRSCVTLRLLDGARLVGVRDPLEYTCYLEDKVEPITEDDIKSTAPTAVEGYTARSIQPFSRWNNAIIRAIGAHDIAIIGEGDAVIDGQNCFDPEGEENYRGPHAINLWYCERVTLSGYTIRDSANWAHAIQNSQYITARNLTVLGGHDGFDVRTCDDILVEDCVFRTGDDCVAGCDVFDVKVTGCTFNTSCNVFRIGGIGVLIENCKAEGPGYYPHRMTVVRGKNDVLPRTEGRHNTITLIEYFASRNFSNDEPSRMTVRGCHVRGVDAIINYRYDQDRCLHAGMDLGEVVFENVLFEDLERTSCVLGNEKRPTQLRFKNVQATYKNGQDLPLVVGNYVCIAQE